MSRLQIALIALLVVQIIIWLALEFDRPERNAHIEKTKLLIDHRPALISALKISGEDVVQNFEYDKGIWESGSNEKFPLDQEKINDFILKITSFNRGLPVSVSATSHDRFQVSEDNYVFKIVIKSNTNHSTTLFFGNPPTVRQSYVRLANEDSVFIVNIESWELTATIDNWLDTKYLEIPLDDVLSLQVKQIVFLKEKDGFRLESSESEKYDQNKISRFLKLLFNLRVESFVSEQLVQKDAEFETLFTFTKSDGSLAQMLIAAIAGEDKSFFIKRTDKKGVYKVASHRIEEIRAVHAEKFLSQTEYN